MSDKSNNRSSKSPTTDDHWEIHAPHPHSPSTQIQPQPHLHRQQRQPHPSGNKGEPNHIVYLRFPFPRNGFKDPPQASWNADKERRLWEYLSRTLRRADIDWDKLAQSFDVPLPFILKQAAWIYEKELEQVRFQMQRAIRPSSLSPKNPKPALNSREKEKVGDSLDRESNPSPINEDNNEPVLRRQSAPGSGGREYQSPGRRVSFASQGESNENASNLSREEAKRGESFSIVGDDRLSHSPATIQSPPSPVIEGKSILQNKTTPRIHSPIADCDITLPSITNNNAGNDRSGDYDDDDDDDDDEDYSSAAELGYGFESVRMLASSAGLNRAPLIISDYEDDGAFLPIDDGKEEDDEGEEDHDDDGEEDEEGEEEDDDKYESEDGDKFVRLDKRQRKLREGDLEAEEDSENEAERERAAKILDSSLRNFADMAKRSRGKNQKFGENKLSDSTLQKALDARLR